MEEMGSPKVERLMKVAPKMQLIAQKLKRYGNYRSSRVRAILMMSV
jgi:hypothetical protein